MIMEFFTVIFDYVNSLVCPESPSPKDEPRLDLALLARLLILLPALLFLCFFVWVLIFFYSFESFVRICVFVVRGIAKRMVRGYAVSRMLWNNLANSAYGSRFMVGRRLPHGSIEQHALWDQWLDGY